MLGLLTVIAIGFFLGMRHATDPDHVIAVTTIVTRERSARKSALIGAAWGVGHTLTILAVGGAIVIFRIVLPARLGLGMELAVGIMLIVLGVRNLEGLFTWSAAPVLIAQPATATISQPRIQDHHSHHNHRHAKNLESSAADHWLSRFGAYRLMRPLIVGVVHGLAGSAAIALLVLSTIPTPGWAVAYLVVFGFGTILGMMLITGAIAGTVSYGQKTFARIGHHVTWAAGVISVAFGLFIAYRIGFVDGLFTGNLHWIPR
jgi:high-affinity nickel-transport protein